MRGLATGRSSILALVLLRSFVGIVYTSNGLAKVFGIHGVALGPWRAYLIDRADALGIQRANAASAPGALRDLGLAVAGQWHAVEWALTAGEVAVGLALLLGILSRLGAALGLLLALAPWLFTLGAGTWVFDYLFEPVTMLVLLVAPPLPGVLELRSPRRSRSATPGFGDG